MNQVVYCIVCNDELFWDLSLLTYRIQYTFKRIVIFINGNNQCDRHSFKNKQLTHELKYNVSHCWTYMCIFIRNIEYLVHVFPVGVWVFTACEWTMLINATCVILPKKCTGALLKYIIRIFIHAQVIANEFRFFNAKMLRNSSNISVSKNRGGRLATISTL